MDLMPEYKNCTAINNYNNSKIYGKIKATNSVNGAIKVSDFISANINGDCIKGTIVVNVEE